MPHCISYKGPNCQRAGPWVGRSGFEPWPSHCALFTGKTLTAPHLAEIGIGGLSEKIEWTKCGVAMLLVVLCYRLMTVVRGSGLFPSQ